MTLIELNKKGEVFEFELINRLLLDENLVATALRLVDTGDFYFHGKAFDAIAQGTLSNSNLAVEFSNRGIKLSNYLYAGSIRKIDAICRDLKDISNARNIHAILQTSINGIPEKNVDAFVSELQQKIIKGVSNKEVEQSEVSSIIEEYKKQQEFYEDKFKNSKGIIGLSTGYKNIDNVIDGLRPEHFWIIGGYTNMGKTFASLNLVASLIEQKKRVVFFSVEMSKTDILSRLLGIMTKQNGVSILKSFPHDKEKVSEAMGKMMESELSIYSGKSDLSEVQFTMYEEMLKRPVDLFVIDFIQLLTVKGSRSEYEATTACALELQQMAKRLKVPIIALSQISNEGARNVDQDVMSFKGSGAIASSADLAIEIVRGGEDKQDWKEKMKNGQPVPMRWIIRKNRHGKVGYVDMEFTGNTGVFELSELEKI